jgi:uncharacterized membrane protein SpoIIM required for sporulation
MEIDPNRKADYEMKSEIENQKKTKPSNMFLLFIAILAGLVVIAFVGGFWSSNSKDKTNNMGIVSPQDTAIVTKSDTLKQ